MVYLITYKKGPKRCANILTSLITTTKPVVIMTKQKVSNSTKAVNRYIYKITNISTGNFYIGCRTCYCPIGEDDYMGSSSYWKRNNINHQNLNKEILEKGFPTEEEKYNREAELISKHFSNPKNVNLCNPSKGFWYDASGSNNGMYGVRGADHHDARAIYQFSKNGEFIKEWSYATQPEVELNYNHSLISRCLHKNAMTAYGFVWRFKDEVSSIKKAGREIKIFFKNYEHPFTGRSYSKETLKKMSEARKGMYVGEKHPFYGKSHTDKTRNKISEALSEQKHPFYGKKRTSHSKKMMGNSPKKKKVIQVSTGEIFESLSEASRQVGLSAGNICGHCKGKYAKQKFKYYEYQDLDSPYSEKEKQEMVKPLQEWLNNNKNPNTKRCKIIKTGQIFESAKSLANHEGVSKSVITNHCYGRVKKPRYKYIED